MTDIYEAISMLADLIGSVLGKVQSMEFLESVFAPELHRVYERALVNLLKCAQRCMRISGIHKPVLYELDDRSSALRYMYIRFNSINDLLPHIDSRNTLGLCFACSLQSHELTRLKSQLAKLDEIILELLEMEMFLYGTALRIRHPVLQLAWALANEYHSPTREDWPGRWNHSITTSTTSICSDMTCAPSTISSCSGSLTYEENTHWLPTLDDSMDSCKRADRDDSYIELDVIANSLMMILQHEIGGAALASTEALWIDCVLSFVSKFGDPDHGDMICAAKLNGICKLPQLVVAGHVGSYSVRQMLIESEFSHGSEMLAWKEDTMGEAIVIKYRTLTPIDQEAIGMYKFIIPPELELFLGVDVCVVLLEEGGASSVQYQVNDCPAQDAMAIGHFELGIIKFTIGSGSVQPGDEIKIILKGPLIKADPSMQHLSVVQANAVILTRETQGEIESKKKTLTGIAVMKSPSSIVTTLSHRAPVLDWSIIATLDELKQKIFIDEKWRVILFVDLLKTARRCTQSLTCAIQIDLPSALLTNNVCDVLDLLNLKLKSFNEALQDSRFYQFDYLVESQYWDLEEIIRRLVELEESIFGSAIRIQHPVLQHAWMLAGANQRSTCMMPRRLLAQNLFVLLEHEIGENHVSNDFEAWNDKIMSLVSILGNMDSTSLFVEELNSVCPSPLPPQDSISQMLAELARIISHWSPLVERKVIVQQGNGRNPALILMEKVIDKVSLVQSMIALEQDTLDLEIYEIGGFYSLLSACRCLSIGIDLLPEMVLDDVCGMFTLAVLVLDALTESMNQIKASFLLKSLCRDVLKDQLSVLDCVLVSQMQNAERYVFGPASNSSHPVLQRAWALLGGDRHTKLIPRVLMKENLLALLRHEIGDAAFEDWEAIWKGCVTLFLLKICKHYKGKLLSMELCRRGGEIAEPPGDHSVRRMLIESVFSYDTQTLSWTRESQCGCLIINQIPLRLSLTVVGLIEEPNNVVYEFNVPQMDSFLGVDVCVEVEANDTERRGLAKLQYQIGDRPPQLERFLWCKGSTCEFTIGSGAAKAGDHIKVWITWPEIIGLVASIERVEASAVSLVNDVQENVGSE